MVCSFFFIVLPAVMFRAAFWFFSYITGRSAAKEEPAKQDSQANPAKKGTCPYHAFMNFFGFKIPEKKKVPDSDVTENANSS